jgi:predicted nucleic acid-binding Zn ribbon protein
MDSCTTGPKYCQQCGKELEFNAKVCEFCEEILEESTKRELNSLTKRPIFFTLIGFSLILISYLIAFSNPFHRFLYGFFTSIIFDLSLLPLIIFVIGFFFVYFSNNLKVRGLIQIGIGVSMIYLHFFTLPIYCNNFIDCLRHYLFLLGFCVPAIILFFFGIITMKEAPVIHIFGFFLGIYCIGRINSLIFVPILSFFN